MFPWYALQIWPNHEASITEQLSRLGVESYYPSRPHPSKRAVRPLPLFPGYLFARFDFDARVPVLRVPHVRLVGNEGSIIAESEIAAIRQLVDSGHGLFVHYSWEPGRRVAIESGPFAGVDGVVISCKGHERILVSVSMLHRAISVEMDAAWLYPIGRAA